MTASGWSANQFSSLLGAYRTDLGLTTATTTALFAVYVLGLIPGLLLGGPLADRRGRRPVVFTALAVSVLATCLLMAGPAATWALWPGRFLTGLGAGALLTAGSVWIKELSTPPYGTAATPGAAARRAGLFLSAGFASGGLAAALIAQWAPHPMITAYLPHLALAATAARFAAHAPETSPVRIAAAAAAAARVGGEAAPVHPTTEAAPAHLIGDSAAARTATTSEPASAPAPGGSSAGGSSPATAFRRLVVPVAPWVFAAPTIAFATLPSLVDAHLDGWQTVYAGVATAVTPGAGLLVAPLARRLAARHRIATAAAGLAAIALGLLVAALAVAHTQPAVALAAAALLGAGYGLCVAYGLTEVAALAPAHRLARLTARFWALCYLGFITPYAITLLTHTFPPPAILIGAAALAVLTLATVTYRGTRSSL
ncbi:MFS transporter [Streptomyces celluloflavus]|uniref:MFS transporter n=1 Tax=Streptomyces celluloflavus TaxID=58344 RepID=UPI0036C65FFB